MRPTDVQKAQQTEREALRQRIDAELADMGPIPLSSWMMAVSPTAAALEDGRVPATEVELDAALGALIWRARDQLQDSHSYHVIGPDGALVAVLMPGTGQVAARQLVGQDELDLLELHRRPVGAGKAPPDYRQTHTHALLWRFAQFGEHDDAALPAGYRQQALRLRQAPPLDRSMVAGRHVKLMRLLHEKSRTFDELQALTGLSERQLHRDLAALHLVGSIVPT